MLANAALSNSWNTQDKSPPSHNRSHISEHTRRHVSAGFREQPTNPLLNVFEQRGRSDAAGDYNENPYGFSNKHRGRSRDVDRSQQRRFDATTLEGRLKPSYERRYDDSFHSIESLPASPSRGRALELSSRGTRVDDRDHYDPHNDRISRWDRPNSEQPFVPRSPSPYLGRQRLEPPPTDLTHGKFRRRLSGDLHLTIPPNDFDRPRSLVTNGVDYDEYGNRSNQGDSQALNPRRGGSLLDRLSLGMSEEQEAAVRTSLRDTDDVIARRDADQVGRSGGGAPVIGPEYGGRDRAQDIGSKVSRTRRRGGKPRRTRKGGQ
jgi:hypothetical protein